MKKLLVLVSGVVLSGFNAPSYALLDVKLTASASADVAGSTADQRGGFESDTPSMSYSLATAAYSSTSLTSSVKATASATWGHVLVDSFNSPYGQGSAYASWTDHIVIDSSGLTGAQGFIDASIFIRAHTVVPHVTETKSSFFLFSAGIPTIPAQSFLSDIDNPPGTEKFLTGHIGFVFGQPLEIQVAAQGKTFSNRSFAGNYASTEIFWDGIKGITLADSSSLDMNTLSITSVSGTDWRPSMVPAGVLVDDPLLPGADGPIIIPIPDVPCPAGMECPVTRYLDPEVAVGYDYAASAGVRFLGFEIPHAYGDGAFSLWLFDEGTGEFYDTGKLVYADEYFDFRTQLGLVDGLEKFSVRGIEVEAMVDPTDQAGFVTSLTMVGDGEVYMTPLTVSLPVPEPETWAMLLAGLGLVGLAARQRKQGRFR